MGRFHLKTRTRSLIYDVAAQYFVTSSDARVANSVHLRAFAFLTARGQGGSLPL